MAPPAIVPRYAEIKAYGLCVPDVKISVRLWGEPRHHLAVILVAADIIVYDIFNEIR
jgi:hypothetical protein